MEGVCSNPNPIPLERWGFFLGYLQLCQCLGILNVSIPDATPEMITNCLKLIDFIFNDGFIIGEQEIGKCSSAWELSQTNMK